MHVPICSRGLWGTKKMRMWHHDVAIGVTGFCKLWDFLSFTKAICPWLKIEEQRNNIHFGNVEDSAFPSINFWVKKSWDNVMYLISTWTKNVATWISDPPWHQSCIFSQLQSSGCSSSQLQPWPETHPNIQTHQKNKQKSCRKNRSRSVPWSAVNIQTSKKRQSVKCKDGHFSFSQQHWPLAKMSSCWPFSMATMPLVCCCSITNCYSVIHKEASRMLWSMWANIN